MTKKYIIKLIVGAIILFIAGVYVAGEYPLLNVDGHLVMAREVTQEMGAVVRSYTQLVTMYGNGAEMPSDTQIKAAVLMEKINQILVHDELAQQMDAGTLAYVINEKLKTIEHNASVVSGSEKLYGLPFAALEDMIFRPQAESDILSSRLFAKNIKLEDWLSDAQKKAKVTLFSSGFSWNGEVVAPK